MVGVCGSLPQELKELRIEAAVTPLTLKFASPRHLPTWTVERLGNETSRSSRLTRIDSTETGTALGVRVRQIMDRF